MSNTIVLKVAMMCGGCSGAVERVLSKMEGCVSALGSRAVPSPRRQLCARPTDQIRSSPSPPPPRSVAGVDAFDVNLETQKVTVKGSVTQEEVIEKIAKTGKAVEPWAD